MLAISMLSTSIRRPFFPKSSKINVWGGGGQPDDLVEAAGEAQGRQEPLQGLHVDAGGVHAVGQDGGPGRGCGGGARRGVGPGCGRGPSGQHEDLGPERGGRPARQVQDGGAGLVVSTHSRQW